MAVLSALEIYQVAVHVGFPPDRAVVFTAIALAESGGRADAHNSDGEDSRGLWQINVDPDVRPNTWGDLFDPVTNARAAYEISGGGVKISPWSVTHASNAGTARDYREYLDEAQQAAAAASLPGGWAGVSSQGPTGSTAATHVLPVPGAELVDTWGAPRSEGRTHEGIDLMAPRGTPIYAITGGTVVQGFSSKYGGKVVRVEGDDGRYYYYAHLDSINDLQVGQRVETGDVLGTVGNTGNAATTPPHLHLQIRENGTWINPYDFLQGLSEPSPVLEGYEMPEAPPPEAVDGDGDGILDPFEELLGTDPSKDDSDDDGLSDAYETAKSHTNPLSADTDEDGTPDAVEVAAGTDAGAVRLPEAAVRAGYGGAASQDSDSDGLSDLYEVKRGMDPYSSDGDDDELPDAMEVALGSDPRLKDSDGDGLTDGAQHRLGLLQPMAATDGGCPSCASVTPCSCVSPGSRGSVPEDAEPADPGSGPDTVAAVDVAAS